LEPSARLLALRLLKLRLLGRRVVVREALHQLEDLAAVLDETARLHEPVPEISDFASRLNSGEILVIHAVILEVERGL